MLDEKALRRPGFVEGVRVALGDGRDWTIPGGVFSLKPVEEGSGRTLSGPEVEMLCGADFDEPADFVSTLLGMGARLLASNYDLSASDFALLLEYDAGSPSSVAMWRDVVRAVRGESGERTYAEWLRTTLAANGVGGGEIPIKEAASLADLFVAQGRAIPAGRWVDDAIAKREREELERMF